MNIYHLISKASTVALLSSCKQRVGCLLLKKGRIISVGFNKIQTSPKLPGYYSLHAECAALSHSDGDTIIVVRLSRNGQMCMSHPCAQCLRKMLRKTIRTFYWIGWAHRVYKTNIRKGELAYDPLQIS